MLVLQRSKDERVVIRLAGEEVVVVVVGVRDGKVRLGFDAPRRVSIYRGEVQQAIDRETAAVYAGLGAVTIGEEDESV